MPLETLTFFLFILAEGCTNLIPPDDAWIKREDDKIIIGCYTSRQTWQLRCHDGRWTGVVSNCSHTGEALAVLSYFVTVCLLSTFEPRSSITRRVKIGKLSNTVLDIVVEVI